jgi:hypothetical protein
LIIRIITNQKRTKWLCELIGEFFDFTLYKSIGCFLGTLEKSLVFEIDTLNFSKIDHLLLDTNIDLICRKIKGYNRQDVVLVQKIESTSKFV